MTFTFSNVPSIFLFIWVIRCACQEGHWHGWMDGRAVKGHQSKGVILFTPFNKFSYCAHPWFCLLLTCKNEILKKKLNFTSLSRSNFRLVKPICCTRGALVKLCLFCHVFGCATLESIVLTPFELLTLVRPHGVSAKLVPCVARAHASSAKKKLLLPSRTKCSASITEKLICFVVFNHFLLKRNKQIRHQNLGMFSFAREILWLFGNIFSSI